LSGYLVNCTLIVLKNKTMRFFIRLFAIATIFLLASSANANHVLGGNLTWDCLGGNQYTITMQIYKDCFGASPALSAENLFVFPTGCVLNPQNITLNLISTTEISNLCASELPSSSCLGGLSPGTQMLTYQATVTLAPGCTWEVIWNEGDWNYFNNINYSSLPDAYLNALINTNYCADSPVITSMQVPYVCRNNGVFIHTPTVTPSVGITASYALSVPQTTGATLDAGINVPGYVNALGATVNATTGAVSINTNGIPVGNFIVTVEITLTQGGNVVGTYYENMVFVIRDCAITLTTFATPEIQSINIPTIQGGPATINACSGDSVCFTVSASNTNLYRAITITSSWSAGLNVGTPVFTQSNVNYNPASATLCFTAQPAMVGLAHTINFHAEDNACNAPQSDDQVVTVNVFPSVTLNPTTATICDNAPVTVTASGGTTYTWSVLSGDITPGFDGNSAVQVLESISDNTVIMVSIPGVPVQCNATDTLTVTVPQFTVQPLTSQSICVGGTVSPLSFTLTGATGALTYQWYSNAANANTGGTAIAGATNATFTPSSTTAGTTYYYCVVTIPSLGCPNISTNTAELIVVPDPTIGTQPLPTQTICLGGTATLSISYVNGLGNATYQWYSNTTATTTGGSPIGGATSATYTTPVLNTVTTRNYYCIVTLNGSGCGTAVSTVAQVIVAADPTIFTQPTATQSICIGATPAAISVGYTNGAGTPSYQWYSNTTTSTTTGTAIPGETSATLTFSAMNTPGTYYYYCVITLSGSGCNIITSATSQVIVVFAPTIATQPQSSQTVCLNGIPNALTVTLNNALGTITYQWYCTTANNNFSGSAVAGATSATFVPPTNITGTRYYYCRLNVLSSICAPLVFAVVSAPGAIIVVALPTVNTQPTPTQTVCIGGAPNPLTMSYTGGTGTPSYQWFSNTTSSNTGGTPIAGATTNSYSPPANTLGTFYYYGRVTLTGLGCGGVSSNVATINVIADPIITTEPTPLQTICVGGVPASLSTAYSGGIGTATYQWFSNITNSSTGGTAIAGATAATYVPLAINTSGSYFYYGAVTLSGSGCGTVTSMAGNVVVVDDPSFSIPPLVTQTICTGGATTPLSVTAIGGTGTLTYQWFSNTTNTSTGGIPIAGEIATTYTPPSSTVGTVYYYCEVSATGNGCGTAASSAATVNVVVPPTVSLQPTPNQTICDGGTATALTVTYSGGTGTAGYQWFSNTGNTTTGGTSIVGATNASYTPTGLTTGTYYYYCVITLLGSACGTATSNTATVVAVADPTITTPPTATQTICVGGTPSALTLAYSNGTGTASYQWYSNTTSATTGGTLIAGATSASYAPPVLNTAGSFYYYGIATLSGSGCGAATSASAEVIVIADPIISTPPTGSQTVCTGGTLTPFTIASSGGTGTTSYQWYSNTTNIATGGTSIAGATNASYTPVTTAVGTLYYYSVATLSGSGCVSAASSTAAVIVVVPPTVSAQPTVTQTICDGGTATALTVAYSGGTGTASYQWYSNISNTTTGGTIIPGETNASYTPTGLTTGTYYYYCVITLLGSACGTATSNTATVVAVADPTITTPPTATQTICVGGTPSALTLAYSNGTGTASYQWYSNTTSATTGGTLIAGATSASYAPPVLNTAGSFYYYGIATLSGSGCGAATTVSSEVVVVADPTISVQPLTTQTNCQNGVSTPLTVTIAGGTGTTTYQWYTTLVDSTVGGVASGNTATLTPLTVLVGTAYVYCVVNTTGEGCSSTTSATAEVIVLPIPSITTQPLATQTVCQNGTTSALTFTVANASGTTTYQWYSNSANSTTGGTAIAGATAVSFNPGATTVGTTYFYCVSTVSLGGSGCGTVTTVPAAVIVVGLPSIATQPTATQNICVGGTPSQLSMTYAGGTGTASYQWYSNTSNTTTGGAAFVGATSASFTPPTLNTSGSYFYYGTVTLNGAGCGMATTASSEVLVSPDPIISTQPIAAQDVCLNSPSTAINAAVSGGLGTVSYAWYSNSTQTIPGTILPGANTNTLTPANTPAGVSYYYMVATLSGNGCNAATSNFSQVTVHALPTVTATPVDNSICFGTTTDIVASGATSYVWTAAPTITSPANVAIVTVAPVGSVSYTVQGTDAFGCVNTATATVVAATQLNVQENITTNICYQTCTGAIALTPSGSGSSYTVAWNTAGVTGLNPQNLCPGNYTYTVTDNLTCSFQNTVNIAALPNNPLDNVIITQPTCFGYNNGSIDFQDASAVSFQLVNAATNATIATQPGGLFGTIGAGNYNIIYNDALGCVYDSLNFSVIAQSAQITLNLNAQAPVLCFNQVVPLTAIAGGGDGGAITVTWGSCNTVTNCILGTGNPYNYTLTSDVTLYAQATDATGCASTIQSIALNLANPVQVNLQNGTSSVTICEGDCVNMSAVASGGNNAIAIQWYEVPNAIGGTTLGPNGTSNTICPSNSTSVYVYANDGCAVPDTDTLSITVQSFPTVSFSVNAQEGCLPLTVSFTNNTTPTFNGNCLWSMDDGVTTFANCGDQVFTYTEEGTYSPTLYVISPEGCSTTYSLLAPIVVHGYPVADFSWAPQPVDVTQPVVQFTDASIDAANYLWEFAWLGASDLQNPVFIFPDEDLAEYPVCLTVENSFGCQDTMCRTVRLNSVLQVWVPNAFTPEQDGLNEVFVPVIKGAKPETYHFSIFDRWGTLVFESFEIGEPWIGDVRNGNAFAANGAYIWRLEVQPLEDRSLKLYTGFVTVIR
jgi:hypothetical protein